MISLCKKLRTNETVPIRYFHEVRERERARETDR